MAQYPPRLALTVDDLLTPARAKSINYAAQVAGTVHSVYKFGVVITMTGRGGVPVLAVFIGKAGDDVRTHGVGPGDRIRVNASITQLVNPNYHFGKLSGVPKKDLEAMKDRPLLQIYEIARRDPPDPNLFPNLGIVRTEHLAKAQTVLKSAGIDSMGGEGRDGYLGINVAQKDFDKADKILSAAPRAWGYKNRKSIK